MLFFKCVLHGYGSFPEWAFPKYSLLKKIFFKVPLLFFYSLKANKTNYLLSDKISLSNPHKICLKTGHSPYSSSFNSSEMSSVGSFFSLSERSADWNREGGLFLVGFICGMLTSASSSSNGASISFFGFSFFSLAANGHNILLHQDKVSLPGELVCSMLEYPTLPLDFAARRQPS